MSRNTPAGATGRTGLAGRAFAGALWLGGNTLVSHLANIAVMAVVARLIAPEQFGVFAIAVVVLTVTTGFAELGLASAIPRHDQDLNRIAPTVTTMAIASATALAAAMVAFAPQLAAVLGSAQAAPSIRILALNVLLTGVFAVPGAQLQRDFKQHKVFAAGLAGFVVGNGLLLVLAVSLGGAEAFAWSRVVAQLVTGVWMIASLDKVYRPGWSGAAVPALLVFALPLAAANTLSQVIVNIDNAMVGHVLGTVELGLYSIAFNVSSWAGATLSAVLNGMVLPAVSAARAEGADLRLIVVRSTRAVAFIAAPIAAATCVLARPLLVTVYGARWAPGAPVLAVLAGFGLASVLCLLFANIVVASGRTVRLLFVQLAAIAALAPALYLGLLRFGLVGVGYAHLAVCLLVTLPCYLFALRRATGAGALDVARAVLWPVGAAAAAGAAAWLTTRAAGPAWVQLLVGALTGAAAYAVLAFPIARELLVWIAPQRRRPAADRVAEEVVVA